MCISPVSGASQIHSSQPPSAPQKSGASKPADSVQLSAAAQKALAGGDADGDGDGH